MAHISACHGACEQGLARAGRPDQQAALGYASADLLEFARVLEKVHHFGDLFLGLVTTGHFLESYAVAVAGQHTGAALAKAHGTLARTAHLAHEHKVENEHDDEQGQQADKLADEGIPGAFLAEYVSLLKLAYALVCQPASSEKARGPVLCVAAAGLDFAANLCPVRAASCGAGRNDAFDDVAVCGSLHDLINGKLNKGGFALFGEHHKGQYAQYDERPQKYHLGREPVWPAA